MTWILFSRSIEAALFPLTLLPLTLPSPPRRGRGRARSLPDPFHVALDGDLTHLHDLAALDHDEPRPVGRSMVFGGVGEGRCQPPVLEVLQSLQCLLDRLAGRVRPRPLD